MSENEANAWNAVNGGAPAGSNCAQETIDGAKVGSFVAAIGAGILSSIAGYKMGKTDGHIEGRKQALKNR